MEEDQGEGLIKDITKLVSDYHLDIQRVLDLVLVAFEQHVFITVGLEGNINEEKIGKIKRKFMNVIDHLCSSEEHRTELITLLLGLQLSYFVQNFEKPDRSTDPISAIPYPLLLLVAFLIREEIISFDSVDPYLVKRVFTEENKPVDEDDTVLNYHKVQHEVLNHRYSQMDLKVLDAEAFNNANYSINEKYTKN